MVHGPKQTPGALRPCAASPGRSGGRSVVTDLARDLSHLQPRGAGRAGEQDGPGSGTGGVAGPGQGSWLSFQTWPPALACLQHTAGFQEGLRRQQPRPLLRVSLQLAGGAGLTVQGALEGGAVGGMRLSRGGLP